MDTLPWIEKYKPKRLQDVFLPLEIKEKFDLLLEGKDLQNLILTGPSGIGKSCAIRTLMMEMYGKYYVHAVMDLNIFDEHGIKYMQSGITTFCKMKIPFHDGDEQKYPKQKVIIIDGADDIISKIQDQINNIMHKYKNVVFLFTCNLTDEISDVIQSQCVTWCYNYLPDELIVKKLAYICKKENIVFTPKSLKMVTKLSDGDLRASINKLQLICNKHKEINENIVDSFCDKTQECMIRQLFDFIIQGDLKSSIKIINKLKNNSYSGYDIGWGMFTTLKSDICNDIPEEIRIEMQYCICDGIYGLSEIMNSNLQLIGCIVDSIKTVKTIKKNKSEKKP